MFCLILSYFQNIFIYREILQCFRLSFLSRSFEDPPSLPKCLVPLYLWTSLLHCTRSLVHDALDLGTGHRRDHPLPLPWPTTPQSTPADGRTFTPLYVGVVEKGKRRLNYIKVELRTQRREGVGFSFLIWHKHRSKTEEIKIIYSLIVFTSFIKGFTLFTHPTKDKRSLRFGRCHA